MVMIKVERGRNTMKCYLLDMTWFGNYEHAASVVIYRRLVPKVDVQGGRIVGK